MTTAMTTGVEMPTAAAGPPPPFSDSARRARFERLMLPHRAALGRLAFRLTGDREGAEDLVQEALLRAYAALDTFRPGGRQDCPEACAARSWLYTILRNRYFTEYRVRRRALGTVPLDAVHESAFAGGAAATAPEDPAGRFVTGAQHAAALEAVAALPDEFRIPVLMVDVEGRAYEEVARTLGIPLNTVRSRLHRARKVLQRRLAPWRG